jgi:hypothetical protein
VKLRRRLSIVAATGSLACLAGLAGPVQAASPSVETWTNHVDVPYLSCPGFDVNGVWDISHRLTFFFDANGVAIRDTERVDFSGRFVNANATDSWVPDSGSILYFDTLAPDGSYLTTISNQVRHSEFTHTAGRFDYQSDAFRGRDGWSDASVAALCAALSE